MNNLIKRTISGIIYVALIVGSLLGGTEWFILLTTLFAVLAMIEFHMLISHNNKSTGAISTAIKYLDIATVAALCITTLGDIAYIIAVTEILMIFMILRVILSLYDKRDNALSATANSFLAVIYIGIPLSIAAFTDVITNAPPVNNYEPYIVLIMFIMIWLNDTGAYCVGCTLGKHRLFPRLSPKKSWEGFWGGMAFCIAAGVACYFIFKDNTDYLYLAKWIGFGIVVSVFSTWGDLFESLIKRALNVKDSGHLIPGHGGILDRIDSLLLVAPAILIYIIATEMIII